MKKEYVSYGLIGIVAGLVLGFIVGNWASPAGGSAAPMAASNPEKPASVNSSNSGQALPPGHPALDSGQTIPAPPLPAGSTGGGPAASSPAAQMETAPSSRRLTLSLQAAKKSEPNRSTKIFSFSKAFRRNA